MAAKLHPSLLPYEPTDADPFDAVKAAHLLNRATFGGTPKEVEEVRRMGPAAAADWLLDFPDAGADEQDPNDLPDLTTVEGLPAGFREIRELLKSKSEAERKALREKIQIANRDSLAAVWEWWVRRMVDGPHPLQEKLTLFWHGHFTTGARETKSAALMWKQNELLRRMSAGNFRAFVHAVSRDPAMLDYLNNSQNRKGRPNENYARELMELFTLGIGNYSEQDIKEAARAFTGWTHRDERFAFAAGQHDDGRKTFFGKSGNFGGDEIIELILRHPACAPYVATKLFRYFVLDASTNGGPYEGVDPAVARSLGDVLRESNFELRPLLRRILRSRAFYSPSVIGAQIKSPVQLVMGTVRMLGIEMPPAPRVRQLLNAMGQVPFAPPNVKGWPGGRSWINASTLFARYNGAVWLAGGPPPGADGRRMQRAMRRFRGGGGGGADSGFYAEPADGDSPGAIVDAWVARLIQRPIDPAKRETLVNTLGERPDEYAVRTLVQLIVSMPEYQLC